MASLWSSWDEYLDFVHPVGVDRPGTFRGAQINSAFERAWRLFQVFNELERAVRSISELGFRGDDHSRPPEDTEAISEARNHVIELVYAGEELLLHHERLARTDASYGFLHSHEILREWDRYESTGRIAGEINQLLKDTHELIAGFRRLVEEDSDFLVGELRLPETLKGDFVLVRDLFSLGFEEIGLLLAGRAIEGVLRHVARIRRVFVMDRGKSQGAWELRFKDLIEAFYRIRIRSTDERVLSSDNRLLLDYFREIRNLEAHPTVRTRRRPLGPREAVSLVSLLATRLWTEIIESKVRLQGTRVQKDW